ncbi:hypothetical protein ACE1SV_72190 [Streptomyces sp. E-15]
MRVRPRAARCPRRERGCREAPSRRGHAPVGGHSPERTEGYGGPEAAEAGTGTGARGGPAPRDRTTGPRRVPPVRPAAPALKTAPDFSQHPARRKSLDGSPDDRPR